MCEYFSMNIKPRRRHEEDRIRDLARTIYNSVENNEIDEMGEFIDELYSKFWDYYYEYCSDGSEFEKNECDGSCDGKACEGGKCNQPIFPDDLYDI